MIFLLVLLILIVVYNHKKPFTPKLKKHAYVKKGISKQKLFVKGAVNEHLIRCLKFNDVVLKEEDKKHFNLLKQNGFNMLLPVYKLHIKSLMLLKSFLQALRFAEEYNLFSNVVLYYDPKVIYPKDLVFEISKFSFLKSKIFCYKEGELSSDLIFATNVFNCNYAGNKSKFIDIEEMQIIADKKLNFSREVYNDYSYNSFVFFDEAEITKKRTFNPENFTEIQKIQLKSKLYIKRKVEIIFPITSAVTNYFSVSYNQNLKVTDFFSGEEYFYSINVPFKILREGKKAYVYIQVNLGAEQEKEIIITKSKNKICRENSLFDNATRRLQKIGFVKVFCSNSLLCTFINDKLPTLLLKDLLEKPFENIKNWETIFGFKGISYYDYVNTTLLNIKRFDNVKLYFSLLREFFGICFSPQGINFCSGKNLIPAQIILQLNEEKCIINTEVSGKFAVFLQEVEFSNFNFFSYKTLQNKSLKVCF